LHLDIYDNADPVDGVPPVKGLVAVRTDNSLLDEFDVVSVSSQIPDLGFANGFVPNVKLVYTTPEMAAEIVEAHNALQDKFPGITFQRKLSSANVSRLSEDMRDGMYRPGITTVATSARDRILNGQHTLNAIIQTGKPQWLILISGIPEALEEWYFKGFDKGSNRSHSQRLAISAVESPAVKSTLTGYYIEWRTMKEGEKYHVTSDERCNLTLELDAEFNEAIGCIRQYSDDIPFHANILRFWHFLLRHEGKKDGYEVDNFFARIANGDPAMENFKVWLEKNAKVAKGGGHQVNNYLPVIYLAWNLFQGGKKFPTAGKFSVVEWRSKRNFVDYLSFV
jgi:hypothetical protein